MRIKKIQIRLSVPEHESRCQHIEALVSIDESMQGDEVKKEGLEQKYGDQ
jgi:hypothetical protein